MQWPQVRWQCWMTQASLEQRPAQSPQLSCPSVHRSPAQACVPGGAGQEGEGVGPTGEDGGGDGLADEVGRVRAGRPGRWRSKGARGSRGGRRRKGAGPVGEGSLVPGPPAPAAAPVAVLADVLLDLAAVHPEGAEGVEVRAGSEHCAVLPSMQERCGVNGLGQPPAD